MPRGLGRGTWLKPLIAWMPILIVFCGGARSYKAVNPNDGDTFDFIVVGAGAAGIPVATRLMQEGFDVLLVEAGGDPSALSKIPSAAMVLLGSDLDWQYQTIPNNVSCLASRGRQCRFSRGKCLGGSTSINYMLYTRGNRQDFDYDIPGWSWEDLKPYFLHYEGLLGVPH